MSPGSRSGSRRWTRSSRRPARGSRDSRRTPTPDVRVSFVVPRYGAGVVGGAETLCRLLAEDLAAHGADVEVLTTCAVDHFTWRDHHPEGVTVEGSVPIHRFAVDPRRDAETFGELHARIALGGRVTYAEQIEWMAQSVWSPGLHDALAGRRDRWLVALPYLFGTTFWAAASHPRRTVLMPCAHDEPHAGLPVVRSALEAVAGCIANSEAEARLLARLAPGASVRVAGVGYDAQPPPTPDEVAAFCRRHRTRPGYLLYAGRREAAKGLPALFAHYAAYRRRRPDAPPLALMGSGDLAVPDEIAGHVVELGFVPTASRAAAYAAASVLVHPSSLESFGMVLMEAWIAGTPALVNAASPVLVDHCRASGGGLWFADGAEFSEALDVMLADPGLRGRMAWHGAAYAVSTFSRRAVRERFTAALAEWA